MVGVTEAFIDPPYMLQPGTLVRFESVYDASQPYGGEGEVICGGGGDGGEVCVCVCV